MGDSDTPAVRRRGVLRMIGVGAVLGAGGIGAFAGSAAAWKRSDVDFKGCSEVWIIVDPDDVTGWEPPVAVKVILARPDGTTKCRKVELTEDNTAPIPGQYGDAPIRKVRAGDGEKILGVVIYQHDGDDNFAKPAYLYTNDHRCAMTPNTPSIKEADCYPEDIDEGFHYSPTTREGPDKQGVGPVDKGTKGKGPKK